jgi:phosphate transport system substrate-binding protein
MVRTRMHIVHEEAFPVMKLRIGRLRWALVPALALAMVASLGTGVAGAKKLESATLNGSGSTLQQAFDEAIIAAFTEKNSDITINYAGGGSGKGRQDLADEVVDFAGSDSPFPSADLAKVKGGDILYFPTVVSPVTVSFNLEGIKKLKLSGTTISKIFQGTITKWDDSAIASENPSADLPSTTITVVHRSDSSGTTANFTEFLQKADPSGWKLGVSSTINWPSSTQGASGNSGVAQLVSTTDGAIGYVDYSDAKAAGLTFATVKNQLGKYVKPGIKAASDAANTVAINDNLTYDPIYATGQKSYPITAPTWIIVYTDQTDSAKGAAIKAFLTFALTKGQVIAPQNDYAPLPSGLAKSALAQVKQITVG